MDWARGEEEERGSDSPNTNSGYPDEPPGPAGGDAGEPWASDPPEPPEPPAPIPESCRDLLRGPEGALLPALDRFAYGDDEPDERAPEPWGSERLGGRVGAGVGVAGAPGAPPPELPPGLPPPAPRPREEGPAAPPAGAGAASEPDMEPDAPPRAPSPPAPLPGPQALGSPESVLTPPSLSQGSPPSSARSPDLWGGGGAGEGAGARAGAGVGANANANPNANALPNPEGDLAATSTLEPRGPAWVEFSREALLSAVSLHDMLPSMQQKLLRELRSTTDEVIFERDKRSGDYVVTVTSLRPISTQRRYPAHSTFKNLCEDTMRVRIRARDLPDSFPLVNRYSTLITDWRIAKARALRDEAERGERSAIRAVLPTKRTLSWMHKTVDAIFRARQAALLKEAAAARRAGLDSFEPKLFSAFVDEYALCRLGDAHKASLFRQELEDACRRYLPVSPQARLMLSFLHGAAGPRMPYEERCLTFLLGVLQVLTEVCPETRMGLPRRFCALVERELSVASDSGLWLDNIELEEPLVGPSGTTLARERALARQGGSTRFSGRARPGFQPDLALDFPPGASKARTAAEDAAAFDTATPAAAAAISLPETVRARVVCLPRHRSFLFSALRNATGDPRLAGRLLQALERENIWTLADSQRPPGSGFVALRGSNAAALEEITRMDSVEAEEYTVLEALVRIFGDLLLEVNGPEGPAEEFGGEYGTLLGGELESGFDPQPGEAPAGAFGAPGPAGAPLEGAPLEGAPPGGGWGLGAEEERLVVDQLERLMG